MALDISIDPSTLKSTEDVIQALEGTFQVEFVPQVLKKLDEVLLVERASFRANEEQQRYELDLHFSRPAFADETRKRLAVGMHITILPEVTARGQRPVLYDGTLEVPLSAGDTTCMPFALQLKRAAR
ncbi:hypothetical protein LY474_27805 [Myxococcus stipitatus]|uniref:hypothetical protein n=1 Tax=Myxococcus stipitatus TaxID=83455 RepID=UPI001F336873|nr:hypothetical protein [Myxococcus stipitatus]MCE9671618.1 hypothetical protein [Myxococcus stipitatus]